MALEIQHKIINDRWKSCIESTGSCQIFYVGLSRLWAMGLPIMYTIRQLSIRGLLVPGSTPFTELSLILCICRSTNQTYGSAKTPAILTTPQEDDRLSAPDSASPASTPTGEFLTFLHKWTPHPCCWLSN